jgi:hypothetical protein
MVKMEFPRHTLAVRPVSRPYVRFKVLRENLIFSPLSAYSSTPRAIKDSQRPPNSEYNLHATQQREVNKTLT